MPKNAGARPTVGQDGRGDLEEPEKLLVPSPFMDVEEEGAARVGRVGQVLAGQPVDEPGIHRAEHELAPLGPGPEARHLVEEPHELGAGEIGIEDEARLLADRVGEAQGLELLADLGGAAALPDDGVVDRLAACPSPRGRSSRAGS